MGQCAVKNCHRGRTKKTKLRDIPPNSPLGEILDNWDNDKTLKELDKTKIIKYCVEFGHRKVFKKDPSICLGTGQKKKVKWLYLALNRFINLREIPNKEEIQYKMCWLENET